MFSNFILQLKRRGHPASALPHRKLFAYSQPMLRAFVLFVALLVCSFQARAASRIAFERGDSIWVANLDGKSAKKIAKGSAPDLSADGTRVAFHTDTSTKKEVIRQIAIADAASGKVRVFKNEIPGRNCQRAIWSPDGSRILFEIFNDGDWHLALINADGSGFRYLRKATPKGNSLWSTCWARDGKSIYAQNLNDIFQIDLNGTELKKWSIASVFPKGGLSSGSKLSLSSDGKIHRR
jgi:TolB protein